MSARISSAVSAHVCWRRAADLGQFGGPVQGDPAHQFRGHVVLGIPAGFPDSLVRLPPGRDGAFCLRLHEGPQASWQVSATAGVEEDGVEYRPEDVVLALVERAVPDPYRVGALVAGQLVSCRLG